MIHPMESKLMVDFLPYVQGAASSKGIDELQKLDKTADYTSKEGGGEFYTPQEKKPYETPSDKKFYDDLKQTYPRTTEIQLRKTERIRRILQEYGPEMFYLMADYWNKKTIIA